MNTRRNNGHRKAGHNGSTISPRNGSFALPRPAVQPPRVRPAVEAPRRRPSHSHVGADLDDVAATASPGWSAALRGALVISVVMFAWMAWTAGRDVARANRTVTSASRRSGSRGRWKVFPRADAGVSAVATLIKRPESLDAESKPDDPQAATLRRERRPRPDAATAPRASAVAGAASLPIVDAGDARATAQSERSTSHKEAGITGERVSRSGRSR
jgi:hypothetical protein